MLLMIFSELMPIFFDQDNNSSSSNNKDIYRDNSPNNSSRIEIKTILIKGAINILTFDNNNNNNNKLIN